ncbi:unnamed protein product [Linum tenue]|uniref:Uncharacterized protein n=1 Tax=Linum tenue TaxID=586396 RepID=A0AAV0Q6J2_9ROSI|nr:unnamed protein product [Linum tenue]
MFVSGSGPVFCMLCVGMSGSRETTASSGTLAARLMKCCENRQEIALSGSLLMERSRGTWGVNFHSEDEWLSRTIPILIDNQGRLQILMAELFVGTSSALGGYANVDRPRHASILTVLTEFILQASIQPGGTFYFEHRNIKGLNQSLVGSSTTSNFFLSQREGKREILGRIGQLREAETNLQTHYFDMAHPLRSGSMAQHEAIAARRGNSPKTPPSPNIEQLVRGGEAMRWSAHTSPLVKEQPELEIEHTPQQKKSVLAKVKEKAKKWGRSLSKKKHNGDANNNNNNNNATPSWGVSLDDEDEDDPENLGAPMYESEMAPDGYSKVTAARQHQPPPARSSAPLVLEKHVSVNANSSSNIDNHRSKSPTSKMLIRESVAAGKQPQVSPSPRTLAETLQEKAAPPPPDTASQVVASKDQNLSISTSSQPQQSSSGTKTEASSSSSSSGAARTSKSAAPSSAPAAVAASVTWKHPPASVPTSMASKQAAPPGPLKIEKEAPAPVATKTAEADEKETYLEPKAHSAPAPGKGIALDTGRTNNDQIWDKGVSVKEYLMNKLEPGEDAKALSQVISQAMSPRKAPGDAGVVEKVKEVVSSLWQQEDSSSSKSASSQSTSQSAVSSRPTRHNPPSSPHIPISTNSTEGSASFPCTVCLLYAVEEETQGRILQAN